MRSTLIFLLAVALAGCGSLSAPAPSLTAPAAAPTTGLPDAAQCSAKGGEIRPVCRRGTPTCVILHADAGRSCSDSAQCAGRCVVNRDIAEPAAGKITGICEADSDPCGCSAEIIAGIAQPARCVD